MVRVSPVPVQQVFPLLPILLITYGPLALVQCTYTPSRSHNIPKQPLAALYKVTQKV